MKNTFGTSLTVTLFGESHGEAIGAVLDGLSPGITVDCDYINSKLALRRASSEISTARREGDVPSVYADPTLANEVLGWKATRDLDDTLRAAWKWQQSLA